MMMTMPPPAERAAGEQDRPSGGDRRVAALPRPALRRAVAALMGKELRANAGAAAMMYPLWILGILFLGYEVRWLAWFPDFRVLSTITLPVVQVFSGVFCAVAGLVISLSVTLREKSFDAWAFQIHRPVPRGLIFTARLAAAGVLYVLAAGVPQAALIVLASKAGTGYFHWRMALPVAADFLNGVVWLLAGYVVGDRGGPLVGSRVLPLLVAGLVTTGEVAAMTFTGAAAICLAAILLLGVTAWGSAASHGYALQNAAPAIARWARRGVLWLGMACAIAVFTLPLFWLVDQQEKDILGAPTPPMALDDRTAVQFQLIDGRLVRIESSGAGDHRKETSIEVAGGGVNGAGDPHLLPEPQPGHLPWYRADHSLARLEYGSARVSWYYVPASGRAYGYDGDGKLVGRMGKSGFAAAGDAAPQPFDERQAVGAAPFTYADGEYDVQFGDRTVTHIWAPPAGESLLAEEEWPHNSGPPSRVRLTTGHVIIAEEMVRSTGWFTRSARSLGWHDVASLPLAYKPGRDWQYIQRLADGGWAIVRYFDSRGADGMFHTPGEYLRYDRNGAVMERQTFEDTTLMGSFRMDQSPRRDALARTALQRGLLASSVGPWLDTIAPLRRSWRGESAAGEDDFAWNLGRWFDAGIVAGAIVSALAAGVCARLYRRRVWAWAIAGLLLGPAAMVVLAASHTIPPRRMRSAVRDGSEVFTLQPGGAA